MDLNNIEIKNFRSIKNISLGIKDVGGTKTFSLIGINESGKSSFLEGIDLFNKENINHPKDFNNPEEPVVLTFKYRPTDMELKEFKNKYSIPKEIIEQIEIDSITHEINFDAFKPADANYYQEISLKKNIFDDYTLDVDIVIKKTSDEDHEDSFDFNEYADKHLDYWWGVSPKVTFWKSSNEYLIIDDIDLEEFSKSPKSISIPLTNCFKLANIDPSEIPAKIKSLEDPVQIRNLEQKLSESVTKHINLVWPEHPINIVFVINNKKLSFLVEDQGIKYDAKTVDQRSDGFRQFVSFLLTVSVENSNAELSNTVLLIDEPEIHLHPKAQINILNELIKLTSNNRNNIVFFATHSIYLIDKNNLDRCIKVYKENYSSTELDRIDKAKSTFSEINYEVFDIATTDYHNELYGYLMENHRGALESLEKDRTWFNELSQKKEKISLQKYIRNSIHHPENTSNRSVREDSLRKSIREMREIKYSYKKSI